MEIVTVRDADDPRLADYVQLTDIKLRTSLEPAHGLFVAEGEKVVRRALAAGYPPRSLLLTQRRVAGLADLLEVWPAPVYVVADQVAERVTGFGVHRGVLAAMARLPGRTVASVQAGAGRLVVLEDIVDHGNVGGIFRCAAALGVPGVILSPRCADPLYRRAVKVSMGAVFAIPYARMADWYSGLAELREAGFRLLALTPDQSATPIAEAVMAAPATARAATAAPATGTAATGTAATAGAMVTGRVALLLGTEGDGLSSRWLHEADEAVCIPMAPGAMAAGVDSLNVVAAAAVACHCLAATSSGSMGV